MKIKSKRDEFIQENSPCGGFLQSDDWVNFQSDFGIKSHNISDKNFWSNILEYRLPLVGKYFYIPRGPVKSKEIKRGELKNVINDLIALAKINGAGWIRIDNFDERIRGILKYKNSRVVKAPHDMQPKQIFIIDITKSDDQILGEMKSKTRYNINLAKKRGVKIKQVKISKSNEKEIDDFIDLIESTGDRKGINFHPREYYKKMLMGMDERKIKLYVAKYKKDVIAGAILVVYGKIATYLHGASSNKNRNVMAPFLLQWEMIREAKRTGANKYDLGGVSIDDCDKKRLEKWSGVTRFKKGFSRDAQPVEFSGSYDIIVNPIRYWIYRLIQKIKTVL